MCQQVTDCQDAAIPNLPLLPMHEFIGCHANIVNLLIGAIGVHHFRFGTADQDEFRYSSAER
jgi:hypothetical protein